GAPSKRQGGVVAPVSAITLRAMIPLSPYRNRNATTPTNGGSTAGSASSAATILRPGNATSRVSSANPVPSVPARTTLATASHSEFHAARHSFGSTRNWRTALSDHPPSKLNASTATSSSGSSTSQSSTISNSAGSARFTRP